MKRQSSCVGAPTCGSGVRELERSNCANTEEYLNLRFRGRVIRLETALAQEVGRVKVEVIGVKGAKELGTGQG